MKQLFKMQSIAIALICLLLACKKAELKTDTLNQNEDLKIIKSKGFSIKNIVDAGSHYIVEGDIALDKKGIRNITNKIATEQPLKGSQANRGAGNLVTITNIAVFIDQANLPQVWIDAANNAIGSWNSVPNFGLQFIVTTNQNLADISIIGDNLGPGVVANGGFPVAGNPGDVRINVNHPNFNNQTLSFAQLVVVHEIGHTLAFRHTDYFEEEVIELAFRVDGTPGATSFKLNPDPASVMVSGSRNTNVWAGFSPFDLVAIRQTYPLDPNQIVLNRYRQGSSYLYTPNWNELQDAYNTGWVIENPPGFVFNTQVPGTLPIFRYYRASNVDHLYTMNFNELGTGRFGYVAEGNAGFAFLNPAPGTIPLHRFYKNAKHFYTTNFAEGANNGFTYEGVCAHIMQ